MADAEVQLQPDSTGKSIDNTTVTTGIGVVYRQRISIADATAANNAAVSAAGALSVDGSSVTQPVSNAGLANLDVALSTRTKPADQQHAIVDSGTLTAVTSVTNPVAVTNAGLTNLDVALSTRTKPADQQHTILDSGTLTSITNALPAGTNVIGHVIADSGSTTVVTGSVAVTNAGLSNLDVALSTRTKPADQQHTIVDSGTLTAVTSVTNPVAVTSAGLTNLDVALSTRLKPADTLTAVTTVGTITNPVSTKTALTGSAPANASVGVASAQAVASNASRKGLAMVNTSSARISFGVGNTAVLDKGITLLPGGVWEMDEYTYSTAAINAIASAAASNLAVQEFT